MFKMWLKVSKEQSYIYIFMTENLKYDIKFSYIAVFMLLENGNNEDNKQEG